MHEKTLARFWANVDRKGDDQCWTWLGTQHPEGYGMSRDDKNNRRLAHRTAWEISRGPIPSGICVLHKCDNRICVNPSHLFLGSRLDNTRDMMAKNRQRWLVTGQRRGKLSIEQVVALRREKSSGMSTRDAANKYGISATHVRRIMAGTRHRSIPVTTIAAGDAGTQQPVFRQRHLFPPDS
jgi:hypothetical protein